MKRNIQDLARDVEKLAKEKGFTSIEPTPELLRIHLNNKNVHFLDFIVRKGNDFSGRITVPVKHADVQSQTVEQIGDVEFYDLAGKRVIPPIVGIKEFAEILGWDKARLSTKYSRQREGKKVRNPLPEPVQVLASTPVWTEEQAIRYKRELDE